MRLIKIDPQTRSVEPIELDGGLDSFRLAIGCRLIDVCARQDNFDALTVDDDALYLDPQPAAFKFNGFGPIHGIAIVSGVDEEGDTQEPVMTVEEVQAAINWLGDIHTEPFIGVVSFAVFSEGNASFVP